jgi:hypothetical protein
MFNIIRSALTALVLLSSAARAQLPPPPKNLVDFPISFDDAAPGAFSAYDLLDKPAGRLGPVVVKKDHFYTGEKRIKFWGVNFAFSACFPSHEQAERVASRLAHFGINAVRLHHMDMFAYPSGIFADDKLETLSPKALERLDYLVAALKKEGIYCDLNLHVSRSYAKSHHWKNAEKLPESMDKMLDIFHPGLIAAEKQYAKDLLTHVNQYTGASYASEPSICMVEINNENSLFYWGGQEALAKLPKPYSDLFQKLWNDWLMKKYASPQSVAAVWDLGAQPRGPNVVRDTGMVSLGQNGSPYTIEQHEKAKMKLTRLPSNHIPLARLEITAVDGTTWHLQFGQAGLKVKKGQFYTLSFRARTEGPKKISVGVSQAHDPWQNVGLTRDITLLPQDADYYYGFTATADDDNARISFSVGGAAGVIYLGNLGLRTGGQLGLDKLNENPANGTVACWQPGSSWSAQRSADWYDFIQQTDEKYFVDFKNYLHDDLKVKAPVTGTIGLGPLGTLSQSKMDFVDAHAYWDHPQFPNGDWSAKNWNIKNKPMIDNPAGSPLWGLAATRVAGKPFTVTEYNHAAPNEWQAECIPMIASYAALQDWDAVYLFAYSHNDEFEKDHMQSYFDIEGNWTKMAAMPLGARIFLGQNVAPNLNHHTQHYDRQDMLADASASYYDMWKFVSRANPPKTWQLLRDHRFAAAFDDGHGFNAGNTSDYQPIAWESQGAGTGRFLIKDANTSAFVGFATGKFPVQLTEYQAENSAVQIEKLDSPFAAIILTSADIGPRDPKDEHWLGHSKRLLLFAGARCENTDQQWNPQRTSLSTNWGKAPAKIEVVKATLSLPADYTVRALDGSGKVMKEFQTTNKRLKIGDTHTIWYELLKR